MPDRGAPTPVLDTEVDAPVDGPDGAPRAPVGDAGGAGGATVFRLRDLDRRARWVAAAFAIALVLAPLAAFAWAVPDWTPSGDAADMGIRALDVGTSRTPLVGQPSSSGQYAERDRPVAHPGPTHFYLLAGPVRLLGGATGMPFVSLLITGSCILIAGWAVFRQLGPPGGVVAALLLAAVTFTTGATSLVDPVSSSIVGYPLLCSAILLWCLLRGDLRLLPLATGVVSFAAQQHLSVAPGLAVYLVGGVAGLVVSLARRGRWRQREVQREVAKWVAWSAVVALVVWAPVLIDQLFGGDGNLGRLVNFARSGDRSHLGRRSGVYSLAHVIGLPPLLGRMKVTGYDLLLSPSLFTWISAAAVLVLVAWLGFRWRTTHPERRGLAIMVGIGVVAGFMNVTSSPTSTEAFRLAFYHWAFALAFFTDLVLALAVLDVLRRVRVTRRVPAWAYPVASVTAIALLAVVNPFLSRPSNDLANAHSPLRSWYLDRVADIVVRHQDELGSRAVLLSRNSPLFGGFEQGIDFAIAERGIDVLRPRSSKGFVEDDHLVRRSTVDGGLVLVVDSAQRGPTPPGKLIGHVDFRPGDTPYPEMTGWRLYALDRAQVLAFAKAGELDDPTVSVTSGGASG